MPLCASATRGDTHSASDQWHIKVSLRSYNLPLLCWSEPLTPPFAQPFLGASASLVFASSPLPKQWHQVSDITEQWADLIHILWSAEKEDEKPDNRPFVPSTRSYLYLAIFILIFCLSTLTFLPSFFFLIWGWLVTALPSFQPASNLVLCRNKSTNMGATLKTTPRCNIRTRLVSSCAPVLSLYFYASGTTG